VSVAISTVVERLGCESEGNCSLVGRTGRGLVAVDRRACPLHDVVRVLVQVGTLRHRELPTVRGAAISSVLRPCGKPGGGREGQADGNVPWPVQATTAVFSVSSGGVAS
jgi:hypothetical protein